MVRKLRFNDFHRVSGKARGPWHQTLCSEPLCQTESHSQDLIASRWGFEQGPSFWVSVVSAIRGPSTVLNVRWRCTSSLLPGVILYHSTTRTGRKATLAWKIPWTEEPGRLQSMGSLRVGHDWVTSLSLFTFLHWRRKWQPTPVFLPGESQDGGAWWAAVYGVAQSWTRLKWLSSSSSRTGIYQQVSPIEHRNAQHPDNSNVSMSGPHGTMAEPMRPSRRWEKPGRPEFQWWRPAIQDFFLWKYMKHPQAARQDSFWLLRSLINSWGKRLWIGIKKLWVITNTMTLSVPAGWLGRMNCVCVC